RVNVTVEIAIERVGGTCGQRATDERGQHEPPPWPASGGENHRGQGGDEEKLDDARLGERHVSLEDSSRENDSRNRGSRHLGRRDRCGHGLNPTSLAPT